jgi:hypothetical protein
MLGQEESSDVLAGLLLLAIAIPLLLALYGFWRTGRPRGAPLLWDITFSVAASHVALFMLAPGVLRLFSNWRSDVAAFVKPSEIVFVYVIELVSFVVWAAAISLPRPGRSFARIGNQDPAGSVERIFVVLVMSVGILIATERLLSGAPIEASRYGDATATTITERFLWPLTPLCMLSGSVVGTYVLVRGIKAFGRVAWLCAVLGILSYLATFGLGGVRCMIVGPILWGALVARLYHPQRWSRLGIPLFGVLLVLAMAQRNFLSLREVKADATINDRLTQLRETTGDGDSLFDATEFRLGAASRYSVGFVRMQQTGGEAGWNPIVNSLYAPIPRVFMPDKPAPTSRDGDQYSTGMYLIVGEIEHRTSFSMTDFVTGCHAYWEFGWLGVLALSLVAGLYARSAIWFSGHFREAAAPILLMFFKPWGYNNPKLWVSDIILEVVQLVPPIIVLWLLAKALAAAARRASEDGSSAPVPVSQRAA